MASPKPHGVCPQGIWNTSAACPQHHQTMQVAEAQVLVGAELCLELPGTGTTENVRKLLEWGLPN